jgi:hypothetical protein
MFHLFSNLKTNKMKKIGTKDELVDAVIEEIKSDIQDNNLTNIQELLSFLDNKNLIRYLPKNRFKLKNTLTDETI